MWQVPKSRVSAAHIPSPISRFRGILLIRRAPQAAHAAVRERNGSRERESQEARLSSLDSSLAAQLTALESRLVQTVAILEATSARADQAARTPLPAESCLALLGLRLLPLSFPSFLQPRASRP